MKECVKCKQYKSLTEFYKQNHYKWESDGYDYYCKYCRVGTAIKSHRGGNKKKCSLEDCSRPHYALTYCRTHYARLKRTGSVEAKNNTIKDIYYFGGKPYSTREYHLKYKYGMEISEYEIRAANGCEICGDKPERNLHVDHDHKCCNGQISCGKCVRGIICNRCNKCVDKYETGLIRLDHPDLNKIKEYLEKYND